MNEKKNQYKLLKNFLIGILLQYRYNMLSFQEVLQTPMLKLKMTNRPYCLNLNMIKKWPVEKKAPRTQKVGKVFADLFRITYPIQSPGWIARSGKLIIWVIYTYALFSFILSIEIQELAQI